MPRRRAPSRAWQSVPPSPRKHGGGDVERLRGGRRGGQRDHRGRVEQRVQRGRRRGSVGRRGPLPCSGGRHVRDGRRVRGPATRLHLAERARNRLTSCAATPGSSRPTVRTACSTASCRRHDATGRAERGRREPARAPMRRRRCDRVNEPDRCRRARHGHRACRGRVRHLGPHEAAGGAPPRRGHARLGQGRRRLPVDARGARARPPTPSRRPRPRSTRVPTSPTPRPRRSRWPAR